MNVAEAVAHLKEGDKRGFSQTIDLIISLKNIDLKKPENRFSKDVTLPHGRGKDVTVGVISDSIAGAIAKSAIEQMDKKGIKQLAKKYEFFVCEAPLMVFVGKVLGKYLGPRGKMPKLLLPNQNHAAVVDELKRSVKVRIRDAPSIHVPIGTESMESAHLAENAESVLDEVKRSLPKGDTQIKSVMLKLTMSKPLKVDSW
ncbi:MAG: 50S ribosomal protein L1 [Candidatus Aenigmarchaeota archaeon]|nr:50S ribosomal protein L1 [Candidatus Aenigmarchaeota archaeon]